MEAKKRGTSSESLGEMTFQLAPFLPPERLKRKSLFQGKDEIKPRCECLVRNTIGFLERICTISSSRIVFKMYSETLMLVPETSDGFPATIGALSSLGKKKSVSFHTSSLPED
jgi:hypothetical protein